MTFRSRTAPQQTRRRIRRSDTRHAIYITVTFSLAIIVALSMLGGVFFAGYYTSHWSPIAAVNGQGISNDDVYGRAHVNLARDQRLIADYTTLRNQGKITDDEFTSLENTLQNKETSVVPDALTEIEHEMSLRQWASKNGVSVSSQQVDDQIKTDATILEMRHVMVIGVAADATPPAYAITAAAEQAAQTKAQGYLDEIKGGKKWADVATESNAGNVGQAGTTGDIGLMAKDQLQLDPDLRDAIFSLSKVNDITPILKGTDGVYRFATITEIVPPFVDANWQSSVAGASSGDAYRSQAQGEALQAAVKAVIENKYITTPTKQRKVLEIGVSAGYGQAGDGDEVSIRIMVFAPNHSTSDAANVASTDAAWTDAKTRADAAVAALKADPSKFDSMARDTKTNDDPYWYTAGGLIPWIPADLFMDTTQAGSTGLGLPAVEAAVFATGLTSGQIVGPVLEASQGYVVAEFEGRRGAPDQRIADAQLQINSGADFGTVASQMSETVDASDGGLLGWVSPYQLDRAQENAIFSVPVGSVTPMVNDNGYHIYKIVDEQTRVQDADQIARLKLVVFPRWLIELQGSALIWTNQTVVAALASATP